MGLQQITNTAKTVITQSAKKFEYVSPICRIGTTEELGLKLEQLAGDTFQICQRNGEFKPLKTMEEAVKYAKEMLGIKKFKMSNLDMANYTLQGLDRIKKIIGTDIGITKVVGKNIITHPITGKPNAYITGSMNINKGVLTLSENAMRMDFAEKISNLAVLDSKNLREYMNLILDIESGSVPLCEIMQRFKKLNYIPRTLDDLPNQTVFHEVWHRLHYLNCKKMGIDFGKFGKLEELNAWNISDKRIIEEFLSPEIQKIISDYKMVGDYALTSPCEFVAEIGSIIANGIKPPKKIMDLYYKYGGPKVML